MADSKVYWRRLNMCAEIIRAQGEVSRLQLARVLTENGIDTTPWTIDKIKPDLMEMFTDIIYNKSQKKFFIKSEFSFSSLSTQDKEECK